MGTRLSCGPPVQGLGLACQSVMTLSFVGSFPPHETNDHNPRGVFIYLKMKGLPGITKENRFTGLISRPHLEGREQAGAKSMGYIPSDY